MAELNILKKERSIFKNKNFTLLFMGSFISNIGTMLYNFAISLYILDITDNNAVIAGLYMATGGIVYAILAPFGGAIVDRLDRVRVVYITDFIRGFTILIAGYLLFKNINITFQIPMLFICTIILSINNTLFEPAITALPANILEKNQLQQSNSIMQGSNAMYGILGVFFGAALYEYFGIELVFIVNGLSFIFSAISEMFIKAKTKPDVNHVINFKSVTKDIAEGFKYIVKFKPLLYLIILAMLFNFCLTPATTNGLPYLFKVVLHTNSFYYSLIIAIFSIGFILTSIILATKKQSDKIYGMLKIGFIGTSLYFAVFAVVTHLYIIDKVGFLFFIISIVIATMLMGASNGYVNIPAMTALQVNVDKQLQGRVFSVINVISMGLTPISIALGGIVIDKFGVVQLFYISASIIFVLTFVGLSNKYIKQL